MIIMGGGSLNETEDLSLAKVVDPPARFNPFCSV